MIEINCSWCSIAQALHLLEEFEQLIFSVSPPRQPSSAADERAQTEEDKMQAPRRNGEGGTGDAVDLDNNVNGNSDEVSPFLSSDVDCIVTKAFNFSILLIELDQTGICFAISHLVNFHELM